MAEEKKKRKKTTRKVGYADEPDLSEEPSGSERSPVSIKKSGGLPQIELQFGNALFAKFEIFLFDRNGINPQPIATNQLNSDNIPDIFTISTSVATLDQQILFWQAAISVFDNQPGQTYLMRAIITQDGQQLAVFDKRGPITNTVIDQDMVRFVLE